MKLWLILIQENDHTWLEAAWDDDSTAENPEGWKAEVDRCKKLAEENGYEIRICWTQVDGVFDLFDTPKLVSDGAREIRDA